MGCLLGVGGLCYGVCRVVVMDSLEGMAPGRTSHLRPRCPGLRFSAAADPLRPPWPVNQVSAPPLPRERAAVAVERLV
jgi:hypothetical protein